jgi:magnesium transporter
MYSENEEFSVSYEQISLLVLRNFVFTFKEKIDDLLHPVLKRINISKGRIRSLGADYLTYAILDTIVDQNFIMIDSLDEVITSLESELLTSEPNKNMLNAIQNLKREIIHMRKNASPIRDLLAGLLRSESELIHESTHIYFKKAIGNSAPIRSHN